MVPSTCGTAVRRIGALVVALAGAIACTVPAAAAQPGRCLYRVVHVRTVLNVRELPDRGAPVVARLAPGTEARGSCGRVWSDGRTWVRLKAPGGYAAAHYLHRS